jgi:hypothetical protein
MLDERFAGRGFCSGTDVEARGEFTSPARRQTDYPVLRVDQLRTVMQEMSDRFNILQTASA